MSDNNASIKLCALLLIGLSLTPPVSAQMGRRGEQDAAMNATRRGSVMSLRDIEHWLAPISSQQAEEIFLTRFRALEAEFVDEA